MGEFRGYRWNGREIEERLPKNKRFKDLTGKTFGALEVKEFLGFCDNGKNAIWGCVCQCGNQVALSKSSLPRVKSCGCLQFGEEAVRKRAIGCHKKDSAFNSVLSDYKSNSESRGHSWQISNEVFREVIQMPCIYCGSQKQNCKKTRVKIVESDVFYYTGIDRLKSNKGYIPGNIAPCCTACNFAKGERSASEFRKWLKQVFKYQQENNQCLAPETSD